MSVLIIEGGRPLRGSVDISGAKNSALAIVVAAALATEGECVLDNIPQGSDVNTICQILQDLGVEVWYDDQRRLHVRGETLSKHKASYELVRRMRASFYSAGLLLARLGKAEVPLPGGCAIGSRPVDFHIKGFAQLGAEVVIEHGYMKAEATRLKGAHIYINRSSVGTTINLMIAASLAEGTTVLENAAKEPEVVDLAIFLNGMGAKIGARVQRASASKAWKNSGASSIPSSRTALKRVRSCWPPPSPAGMWSCAMWSRST